MEKLGIQLPLLLTQIANFSILLIVLTKLLYKPILKGLESRRKKIEEGLAFTEKAQAEEEKLAKRKDEVLKESRAEARVILENAKKEAKRTKDEIVASGKEEVTKQKERMTKELEAEYKEREEELMGQTVDVASEMVKRLIPEVVSSEQQHQLIRKNLQKIEKTHVKQ